MLMKRILVIVAILLSLQTTTFAQDADVPLGLAKFNSQEDYERFEQWVGELENIRFALIQSGKSWSEQVEAWAREYIQQPEKVESNDGIFLITYAAGGLDEDVAEALLYTIMGEYEQWLQRKQLVDQAEVRQEWERELAQLNDKVSDSGIVSDVEKLQEQLAGVNQRLLEARLEVAQAEARVHTVMEHAESSLVVPVEVAQAESAQRDLLRSKLSDAEISLERVMQLVERGLTTEVEARRAELQLMEARAELAELEAQAVQQTAQRANADMRRVLIDSESDRAAALALERVLREQQDELRDKIAIALELKRRIESLERKLGYSQIRRPGAVTRSTGGVIEGAPNIIRPDARARR